MDEHNTFEDQNGNEEYSEQNMQQNDPYQNGEPQQNNVNQQSDTYQNNSYMNNGQSSYNNPNYNSSDYGNQYQQYRPYANIPPYNDSGLELEEPVRISEWVLCFVIMMIPCVSIIMMFVWAFSSSEKKSKSNFFKAQLILFGIIMVLSVLFSFMVVILASRF